jgi:hypothetical protein
LPGAALAEAEKQKENQRDGNQPDRKGDEQERA